MGDPELDVYNLPGETEAVLLSVSSTLSCIVNCKTLLKNKQSKQSNKVKVILVLKRQKEKDIQPHREMEASLGYVRPCLKIERRKKKKKERDWFNSCLLSFYWN